MVMKKSNIRKCFMLFSQGSKKSNPDGGSMFFSNLFSKKRGQQSSFGMSFGMIFSIFLILVFIASAISIIAFFLGLVGAFNYGQFYVDLQSEVDSSWKSAEVFDTMQMDLPGDIEYLCFANLSQPITGDDDIYFQIGQYAYTGSNTFMIPPEPAGDLAAKEIKHLDLAKIIAIKNPYCIENPGEIYISKGARSKYVTLS